MNSFSTVVQKLQTHMKKHNMSNPGDVKLLAIPRVIWRQFFILEVVYRWNGEMALWRNGEMVKLWYTEIMLRLNNESLSGM